VASDVDDDVMMTVRRFSKLYNVVVYRVSADPIMSFMQ